MSELTLYNIMTQQKEILKPINPGKIGMYVCGITAYDFSHIDHALTAVSFDVLYRYLRHLGYEVTYVRNFTDVDDKVINRANECGENPVDLSKLFSIIDNDCGYVVSSYEFFSVDKSPNYGQLYLGNCWIIFVLVSVLLLIPRKRNPADFALWKAAKPGEPSWDSPWGLVRPGWHIECSAMSAAHLLSPRFDIHGGGADLKFQHHENEIAQTCAVYKSSGETYGVTYWLHNGHVTNNNVKMGKALDNFFTIREVTAKYHPLALRMSAQYRSPLNYSVLQLETSSDALYYVYQTLEDLVEAISPYREAICEDGGKAEQTTEAKEIVNEVKSEFETKMSDDLNTAHVQAGAFQDAMKLINVSITKLKKMQKKPRMSLVVSLVKVEKAVREVLDVFGLLTSLSYAEFLKEMKQKTLARAKLGEEEVFQMIETRRMARMNKDFDQSDDIRKTLALQGIFLMDLLFS